MTGKSAKRSALVLVALLLIGLGTGTALADRQSAVSPQASFDNMAGATIVTDAICAEARARSEPSEVKVWGSGWASEELILISLIKAADDVQILFSGSVNSAGAFEIQNAYATNPGRVAGLVRFPGAGLFTLEALGTSGRLATAPLMFVEDKCG